jgi:hypothetical protein
MVDQDFVLHSAFDAQAALGVGAVGEAFCSVIREFDQWNEDESGIPGFRPCTQEPSPDPLLTFALQQIAHAEEFVQEFADSGGQRIQGRNEIRRFPPAASAPGKRIRIGIEEDTLGVAGRGERFDPDAVIHKLNVFGRVQKIVRQAQYNRFGRIDGK